MMNLETEEKKKVSLPISAISNTEQYFHIINLTG